MNLQTILYFSSVVLTFILTGCLAWYAWRQPALPGVRTYAWLAIGECALALVEILSMTSGTQAQAYFWFNFRFLFTGIIAVLFLVFALEYHGHRQWLTKPLVASAFIIPVLSQIILWSNSLHGFWVKQDVSFHQKGPFWIADTSARIPGVWFLVHSFYSLALLLAGIIVILLAAWRKGQYNRGQALLLSTGALVALVTALVPVVNLLPQLAFNPFIPGIGISALLYALAIFRFQFLKRNPARAHTTSMTRLDAQDKRSLAVFIFIFILFTSGIAAIGFVTYQRYENQFRAQVNGQLKAVAALKVNQLESWRSERMGDADIFYNNPTFAGLVQTSLKDPGDAQAGAQLRAWLDAVRNAECYDQILLLDTQGVERMASPNTPEPVSATLARQTVTTLGLGQVNFVDFYRDTQTGPIYLALLVPVYAGGDRSHPLGVVVLRIDPAVSLYPFIQEWPTSSSTAETLLVRRDGNNVLYLNELKFEQNTALNLRIPLEDTQVLAVKAVLGQSGVVEGRDYRNQSVLGYVGAVPGSPWFLVARMDTSEVYAPLREHLWQTILFFGVLILAAAAGLLLIWRQQRVRYYRAQLESLDVLRLSEEKFRNLFNNAEVGMYRTRLDGSEILDMNDMYLEILGRTRAEMQGSKSILHWADPHEREEMVRRLSADGRVIDFECGMLNKQGEVRRCTTSVRLYPEQGILEGSILDITDRKQAEEKLIASETRYRRLFEAARDGILILDAKTGVVMDVNPYLVEMLGFPQEKILGKKLWELGFFKDIATNKANFLELQQEEYIRYEDLPLETADGRLVHVEFVSNVYQVNHRKVIQCNIRDITERKLVEEKLAQEQYLLRTLMDNLPDRIYFKDRHNRFTHISESQAKMFGLRDPAEALGKTDFDFFSEAHAQPAFEVEQNIMATGQPVIGLEEKETWPDGRETWVNTTKMPLLNQAGSIIGTFGISSDITERKQAEELLKTYSTRLEADVAERTRELRDAQEKLIRQERLATLGQLAGSVGHELRNPLGVISNAVYFLKMTQPDANATILDYLDIIDKETRTSNKIVTDLLDFTRLKSVEREPADVSALLGQTLKRYPVPASVNVVLDLPADLPPVYADPQQVVQVLGNLVTNACQAMPEIGRLSLSASLQGDMIAIAVKDTGVGIPPENMSKLFEPLFTTKIKGIGLGLAVSQKLAEANDGRIEALSQLGKGSTFTVYLPVFRS